jgi:hypothetical protein
MQTEVAGNTTLAQQPFAHADAIGHIVQETQRLIKSRLPSIHRSMQLYLANRETEFILFRPIKVCLGPVLVLSYTLVTQVFALFHNLFCDSVIFRSVVVLKSVIFISMEFYF